MRRTWPEGLDLEQGARAASPLELPSASDGEADGETGFADNTVAETKFEEEMFDENGSASEIDAETLLECQDLLADIERQVLPTTGFVVSLTKFGGKFRTLHFVGSCYRVPGEHYRDFIAYGDLPPSDHELDARCTQCFTVKGAEALSGSEVSSGSTVSSASASSAPSKRRASGRGS